MSYAESGNLREKYDSAPVTAEAARQPRVGNIADHEWDAAPNAIDAPMSALKGTLATPSTFKRTGTLAEPRVESIAEKVVRISSAFASATLAREKAALEIHRLKNAIQVAEDQEKTADQLVEAARKELADLISDKTGGENHAD